VIKTNIDINEINDKVDLYKEIKHPNISSIKRCFVSEEFDKSKKFINNRNCYCL
jgi:hypothetical protein